MSRDAIHKQEVMELSAELREEKGSRACGRLRKKDVIPVNLYGHKEENIALCVPKEQFMEYFLAGHRIMHLNFDNKQETGMIKEVQYDPLGEIVLHIDFARISLTERVHMRVRITTVGIAKGAASGGLFDHILKEIDIEGPAVDIPEEIELHVSDMAIGDIIRIRDIVIPPSCKVIHAKPDDAVVSIHVHRRAVEVAPAEPTEEAAGEPEIVGKEKEEPDSGEKEEKGDKK